MSLRGYARLVFGRRGCRTVLTYSRVEAPMTVIRPFEVADGRLLVQLITLGPGLCGGDRLDLDITAEDRARVVVTTTAATRVLTMDAGQRAEHHVHLRAGHDCSLEYYPAVTIPFPGSSLVQTLRVDAVAGARIGVIEPWSLGRIAREEYLQFRSLSSRTTLQVDGALTYGDAMHLVPDAADTANAGVLAGRRYVAAGFWQGATLAAEPETPPLAAGTLTVLAQSTPDLVYLRALGADGPELDGVLRRSVDRLSRSWGLTGIHMDRYRC